MGTRGVVSGVERVGAAIVVAASLLAAPGNASGGEPRPGGEFVPIVIGHRGGAAGYLPDHTLENYVLAIELGAEFVEVDLVATKDGHLIVRHEPNLIDTTNVKEIPRFAARRRVEILDGVPTDGYWARDFTLKEIKELGAVQPLADRDQSFNGRYRIPTFEEVLDLARRKSHEMGRRIGIYPETKHPTYHQSFGLPLEDRLLAILQRVGWNHREAPVFIQSFETANLKYMRTKTRVRLIQLVDGAGVNPDGSISFEKPFDKPYDWVVSGRPGVFGDLVTPEGLAEVKRYADGIGPWKYYLMSTACKAGTGDCSDERDRVLLPPTDVVANAHKAGLLVHPFTFRNEPKRLASDFEGNPVNEYLAFYELGIDGVFSDFADTAFAARRMFLLKTNPGCGSH